MKVSNSSGTVQIFPDGSGNMITLQPGDNEIPGPVIDGIKKCIGPERWPNYAQFIAIEGDKVVSPIPVKVKKDLNVSDVLEIIKNTVDGKLLIALVNSENTRDTPRKTVTDAIEKRMIAISKSKKKEKDGEHNAG